MCGILYVNNGIESKDESIQHRGPDFSNMINCDNSIFNFHRLSINDLSESGNQPFVSNGITWMCNGEIYNHKELTINHKIQNLQSTSDCEIIGHLLNKGIDLPDLCELLDGVFAFVIKFENNVYAARDPLGVRPLFWSKQHLAFSSEAKALFSLNINDVEVFPPQMCCINGILIEYKSVIYNKLCTNLPESGVINAYLSNAVNKRLLSDRPIACLLSGGLDSSLIAAIAAKHSKNKIHTFSIGLYKDAPDMKHARIVADHIGSIHHEVLFTPEEGINALNDVIYYLESYDCTTIRASIPMFLLLKHISNNTEFKVILSGEGADELFGGYLYFHNAPTNRKFQDESIRLLKDVHKYDVLRADRCSAAHGLEIRVPFFDKKLVNYILSIDPAFKKTALEKQILRDSFKGLIPDSILYRQKDAFSDAVGYNWIDELKRYTNDNIKDISSDLSHWGALSFSKEELFYKHIYLSHYPNWTQISYQWRPRWTSITDPSATFLKSHNESRSSN